MPTLIDETFKKQLSDECHEAAALVKLASEIHQSALGAAREINSTSPFKNKNLSQEEVLDVYLPGRKEAAKSLIAKLNDLGWAND